MTSDDGRGWLRREFQRAHERSAAVPDRARPVVVSGSLRPNRSTESSRNDTGNQGSQARSS